LKILIQSIKRQKLLQNAPSQWGEKTLYYGFFIQPDNIKSNIMSTSSLFSSLKFVVPALILGLVAGGGMGIFMYRMVTHMSTMTGAVVKMSENVDRMSRDMGEMREQFVDMTVHVKNMHFLFKELTINIVDMNASVISMDNNMTLMQGNIKNIQEDMAKDMKGINQNVQWMADNVDALTSNVMGMNSQMGQMVHDIHRGQTSFTSPINYFRNFMAPNRP